MTEFQTQKSVDMTQAGTTGTIDYSPGGNMIDDNWSGREYGWDHLNRLLSVEDGSSTPKFDFEYGASGERMIQEMHSGSTTVTRAFIYDREDVAVEFSDDQFNTVFRQYIHGPGIDEPLAFLSGEEKYDYPAYFIKA